MRLSLRAKISVTRAVPTSMEASSACPELESGLSFAASNGTTEQRLPGWSFVLGYAHKDLLSFASLDPAG